MKARRASTGRRKISGVRSVRRDTYNSSGGFSVKGGWWEINAKVVKRSGGFCEVPSCTNKGHEVHHIIPLSRGGTTTMSNLIHLCTSCHDRRHNHLFRARAK